MTPKLLILGGTTEATAFAQIAAEAGLDGIVSFAGRVDRPKRQPLPQRIGGFGGAPGLAAFLRGAGITHVIDATHPFAAQMSRNAVDGCASANVPLIALTRPGWTAQPGDRWNRVSSNAQAAEFLDSAPRRVLLAIGRMYLADFAGNPQHHYVLRLVDPPSSPPPFPQHEVIVSRGPFTMDDDLALLQDHAIDLVVSKNSGGTGAYAKIAAARQLNLPVLMIDRPHIPPRREASTPDEVMTWIAHTGADRGV